MPNRRKSDAHHRLAKTWRRDRHGRGIVDPEPIGSAPDWLSAQEKACWRELVANDTEHVLRRADRIVVAMAARLMAVDEDGKLPDRTRAQLITLLRKFGMTPADRSRVKPPVVRKRQFDD